MWDDVVGIQSGMIKWDEQSGMVLWEDVGEAKWEDKVG
jgi:hypothetical protein